MEWLKVNDDGEVELVSEEIKLVPEMRVLFTLNYNKGPKDHDGRKKYRLKSELTYMYLVYSFKSPYKDYTEAERIIEAKSDAGLPEDWKPSSELQDAIKAYQDGIPNKIQRLLKTTERFIDKFEAHLNGVDLNERNSAGTIVHKPTEIMATLERLPRLAETLFELERQARAGVVTKISSRGDHELGWMAINGTNTRVAGVGDNATFTSGEESDGEVQ